MMKLLSRLSEAARRSAEWTSRPRQTAWRARGTSLTVTLPPGSVGIVDVIVTTPGGTSAITPADHYNYAFAVPALSLGSLLLLALGLALAARAVLLRRRNVVRHANGGGDA